MNISTPIFAGLIALGLVSTPWAAPIVTVGGTPVAGQGLTSSLAGVAVLDFNTDTIPAGIATIPSPLSTNLVVGSASTHAAPPGDASRYLAVGPSTGGQVRVSLTGGANYIGFYAGSLDAYNAVSFLDSSDAVLATYTGTQLAAFANVPATGDQAIGRYFNVFETGNAFAWVVLSSSQDAFELDNFAIGRATPPTQIPLPGTLAMLGIGCLAGWPPHRRRDGLRSAAGSTEWLKS